MKTDTTRILWIDIMRGMGIILMIMGHVGFGGIFDRWIHTFHMPLFFVLSGFLYKHDKYSLKKFTYRKLKTLLIPYLTFLVINYIGWVLLVHNGLFLTPIIRAFTFNTQGMPIAGALWFLTAMFFTEMLFCLFHALIPNETLCVGCIFVLSFGMTLLSSYSKLNLPLSLAQGIVGMGFFGIGYLFSTFQDSQYIKKIFQLRPFQLGTCCSFLLIINVCLSFVNGYVNMKDSSYANIFLFWTNAIIGTFSLLFLSLFILKMFPKLKICISSIGKNSIIYLGLNQLVILCLYLIRVPYIGETGNISFKNLTGSIIITILTIICLHFIGAIITKRKIKVLFGK